MLCNSSTPLPPSWTSHQPRPRVPKPPRSRPRTTCRTPDSIPRCPPHTPSPPPLPPAAKHRNNHRPQTPSITPPLPLGTLPRTASTGEQLWRTHLAVPVHRAGAASRTCAKQSPLLPSRRRRPSHQPPSLTCARPARGPLSCRPRLESLRPSKTSRTAIAGPSRPVYDRLRHT